MPNGTELHVGFFAPQSKHIWPTVSPWGVKWGAEQGGTYFVGRLGFELGEDVLRLCLGGEGHGESEAAAMGTPDEDGGSESEAWWGYFGRRRECPAGRLEHTC
jgi:hypothetical protein